MPRGSKKLKDYDAILAGLDKKYKNRDYWLWTNITDLVKEIFEDYSAYNIPHILTVEEEDIVIGKYCDGWIYKEHFENISTIRLTYKEEGIIIGAEFQKRDELVSLLKKALSIFNDHLFYGDMLVEGYETGCGVEVTENEGNTTVEIAEVGTIFRL